MELGVDFNDNDDLHDTYICRNVCCFFSSNHLLVKENYKKNRQTKRENERYIIFRVNRLLK